ncbi:MAG: peptidoglycan DD-metalloendopeptidase family protein [Romboutsia timonensis]|uniref:peptidoglycan DD-metalloendopeptidase family protein n=1 Tax=Romboutsia timonensis TaxID=1776391 RepID=UPI0039A29C35
MATAAINFGKKLFGFDIDTPVASDATADSSSSSDGSDLSSGTDYSSVKTKVSSSDFDKSVILGDSIAKGFKDMKVLPSSRVVATIGDTVAKGISDGNVAKAAAKKPPVIITHYGTNDADWISGGGSFNADWYSKQYTKLINKIKKESPKSKIVLTQTFTPSGGKTKKWVPVVQKALPGIASKNSVNIVDSRSIDKPSYRGSDHIHPISKEFYTKWLADIKSKITSEGKGEDTDLTKDIDSYFQDTLDGVKSSDFGIRDNEFHTGVDYAAKENTPIKSPVSGKVVENLKDKKYGFGNTLVVRDKKGIDHRFAHMKDQSSYGLGTKVRQNDIIGNVGSTGRSTGSHLHYEVTDNGKSLNPSKYYDKTAHGGTKNSLDKVTLSFPDSDQKVDANISNLNKGIDEKVLKQLITIIVSVLNKVANNTENIKQVVDLLTEIQKSITGGKPTTKTKTTKPTTKSSSDTDKTKTQKIFSLLQKGMNSTDSDTSNTQAILDILEILATE